MSLQDFFQILRISLQKFGVYVYTSHISCVAFWVTNPCRITRNVEQTKMYVCTLKNIYSSRYLDALLYKLELSMELNYIGICRSLYTNATIEEKG